MSSPRFHVPEDWKRQVRDATQVSKVKDDLMSALVDVNASAIEFSGKLVSFALSN